MQEVRKILVGGKNNTLDEKTHCCQSFLDTNLILLMACREMMIPVAELMV